MITFAFYHADKTHEELVACAFVEGAKKHGFNAIAISTANFKDAFADVGIAMGVKGATKDIMNRYMQSGKRFIYIDKGYTRRKITGGGISEYYRVSVDSTQPTAYFQNKELEKKKTSRRWEGLDYYMQRMMHNEDGHIIFAGSSQKYCDFHELGDATEYAKSVINELRKHTDKKIIYRPKPSWADAVPIEGTQYSGAERKLWMEFENAYALITHGSNACFDAILNGVPIIVLGDGIGRPLARTEIKDINNLYYPEPEKRYQWCCDLAYCQWTLNEINSGIVFKHLNIDFGKLHAN